MLPFLPSAWSTAAVSSGESAPPPRRPWGRASAAWAPMAPAAPMSAAAWMTPRRVSLVSDIGTSLLTGDFIDPDRCGLYPAVRDSQVETAEIRRKETRSRARSGGDAGER